MSRRFTFPCLVWLAFASAAFADMPVLSASAEPFSFIVMGDLHLSRPAFTSQQAVQEIAASVENVHPPLAFVCQTGDLAHGEAEGHKQLDPAGMAEELSFAVTCVTQQFNAPLFIAVGNHDKHATAAPYRETVLPVLSRELGVTLDRNYYAFRYGNACFVFLDYGDYSKQGHAMDYAAQRRFLEATLAQARADAGIRHVFAFGHYPFWPAVRPGFCNTRFTDSVVPVLAAHPVDAYFCGHTHNSGAWVRHVNGMPVVQIMGVAMDASRPLQSMDETRTLLMPRGELSYGWGYLSGPPNGFYRVEVDGPCVRVQFRSGREVLREFTWREPGKITDVRAPSARPPASVSEAALRQAVSATLIFTPWADAAAAFTVRLNGGAVGAVRLEPMPSWAAFASEKRVPIPAECLKSLRPDNEIMIENPGRALFGIGNLRLDVKLADGTTARTAVFDRFLLSAEEEEARAQSRSTLGWEIIPPGVRATVRHGQPLGPVRLSFPRGPAAPQTGER